MPRSCESSGVLAMLLFCLTPHEGDLPGVARQVVGGLQAERQVLQGRVVHDPGQGLQTDAAFTDAGVAVLPGAAGVQAVVEVDGLQPRQRAEAAYSENWIDLLLISQKRDRIYQNRYDNTNP